MSSCAPMGRNLPRSDISRLVRRPTSIAYLFLSTSARYPDLKIEGRRPAEWCKAYLELGQDSVPAMIETKKSCGITNEYLASNALKACCQLDITGLSPLVLAVPNRD
ncbi:hypothetical protein NA56DRAFT_257688 [Hyaloscypha hepaticicola]|uniref:Uncharacterized protein n=1 Tax=Hyaloscypha hepaticicola TaxID=2082293 RepID=A0A2J6PVL5_9HELO|nr:hypothetical protein NA56DRAFT_257688 [Hyaloscypha hepaticicola]